MFLNRGTINGGAGGGGLAGEGERAVSFGEEIEEESGVRGAGVRGEEGSEGGEEGDDGEELTTTSLTLDTLLSFVFASLVGAAITPKGAVEAKYLVSKITGNEVASLVLKSASEMGRVSKACNMNIRS